MLDRIRQWATAGGGQRKPQAAQAHANASARAATTNTIQVAPAYPPVDPGLPACSVDAVIESQRQLIKTLERVVSADDSTFARRYLAPIRELARYVHLLPASAHEEFAGAGGLFRLALEMAVYSTQAAEGRIFTPTDNVEARHALEPRWKYAAFLAGLTCELYRPLSSGVITTESGAVWPKFLTPLSDWLQAEKADRFFVNWMGSTKGSVSGAEGSAVIGKILPTDQLTWLDQGSPAIVRDVMAIALGQSRPGDSILGETVQRIRDEVLKRDEVTRRSRYGRLTIGNHLEPYVMDALRHLVETGVWKTTKGDGPIYFGTDGMYVEWPKSFDAVRSHLVACGVAGVPKSATTLAEILGRAGAVISQESGQWLWDIIVSEPRADVPVERKTALRFKDAGAVLGTVKAKPQERPFAEALVVRVSESAPAATSVATSAAADVYASLPTVKNVLPSDSSGGSAASSQEKLDLRQPVGNGAEAPSTAPASPTPAPAGASPAAPAGESRASPPVSAPASAAGVAAAVSHASHLPESVRAILKASDAEMIGRWVGQYLQASNENVCDHSGNQIAVSKDYIEALDLDFSRVVTLVERYQWLGRPDDAGRGARVGEIQFADKRKFGFVLTAEAAKSLGFRK